MRIEKTEFVFRDRNFWEALDLGVLMFARWLAPVFLYFGLPFLVFGLIAALICGGMAGEWAFMVPVFLVWWFKPFWDRLILAPAAILLFDPTAGAPALLKALKNAMTPSLLADLSWRRLSFMRAYLLPLRILERPASEDRRVRKSWLCNGSQGMVFGLTVLCIAIEIFVFLSVGQTISFFTVQNNTGVSLLPDTLALIKYYLPYVVTILIVEPLFVLSCFALYVNRRTKAEGWDLELTFLRLRSRQRREKLPVLLLILCLTAGSSQELIYTQEPPVRNSPESDSEFIRRAENVVSDEMFGRTETIRELIPKQQDEPDSSAGLGSRSEPVNRIGAEALRVIVIVAGILLLMLVLFLNRRRIPVIKRMFPTRAVITGGTVSRENHSPSSMAAWIVEARRSWRQGEFREGLSYLYRGAVDHAVAKLGLRIPEGATEGECLREARRSITGAFVPVFSEVVRAWVGCAWAGQTIENERFEILCQNLENVEQGKTSTVLHKDRADTVAFL